MKYLDIVRQIEHHHDFYSGCSKIDYHGANSPQNGFTEKCELSEKREPRRSPGPVVTWQGGHNEQRRGRVLFYAGDWALVLGFDPVESLCFVHRNHLNEEHDFEPQTNK